MTARLPTARNTKADIDALAAILGMDRARAGRYGLRKLQAMLRSRKMVLRQELREKRKQPVAPKPDAKVDRMMELIERMRA